MIHATFHQTLTSGTEVTHSETSTPEGHCSMTTYVPTDGRVVTTVASIGWSVPLSFSVTDNPPEGRVLVLIDATAGTGATAAYLHLSREAVAALAETLTDYVTAVRMVDQIVNNPTPAA